MFLSNHQIFRLKDIDSAISNLRLESKMLEWRENNNIKSESPPKEIENLFFANLDSNNFHSNAKFSIIKGFFSREFQQSSTKSFTHRYKRSGVRAL